MVTLAATAIERHALAAVAINEGSHPPGDLRNRHVPLDRVKTSVGAATQWRGEPVLVVRIVGYARGLVAKVPL